MLRISLLKHALVFSFSSQGEQGNTVSRSLALRESPLSLACTEILETVEVSILMKLLSNSAQEVCVDILYLFALPCVF